MERRALSERSRASLQEPGIKRCVVADIDRDRKEFHWPFLDPRRAENAPVELDPEGNESRGNNSPILLIHLTLYSAEAVRLPRLIDRWTTHVLVSCIDNGAVTRTTKKKHQLHLSIYDGAHRHWPSATNRHRLIEWSSKRIISRSLGRFYVWSR